MTIMVQVLEQAYSPDTPWEQCKYAFVDVDHIVTMRLDGQCGVWLDVTKHGESHRLAAAPTPAQAIFFLLDVFSRIAECKQYGGSWIIGHDGRHIESIHAARFPQSLPA